MSGGDENYAAFEALYLKCYPGLVRWLRPKLGHNHRHAEEIAQDAFLIVWQRWAYVCDHPCPKAYLFTVSRHLVGKVLEKCNREVLKDELPDQAGNEWDEPSDGYNLSLALREAIDKLTPRQREAVLLFYAGGFKQIEMATIMQIKRGAVAALLYQARCRLAGFLGL
jgi:RNA polymerase sigma-70 factor (ECF subfamily)